MKSWPSAPSGFQGQKKLILKGKSAEPAQGEIVVEIHANALEMLRCWSSHLHARLELARLPEIALSTLGAGLTVMGTRAHEK